MVWRNSVICCGRGDFRECRKPFLLFKKRALSSTNTNWNLLSFRWTNWITL